MALHSCLIMLALLARSTSALTAHLDVYRVNHTAVEASSVLGAADAFADITGEQRTDISNFQIRDEKFHQARMAVHALKELVESDENTSKWSAATEATMQAVVKVALLAKSIWRKPIQLSKLMNRPDSERVAAVEGNPTTDDILRVSDALAQAQAAFEKAKADTASASAFDRVLLTAMDKALDSLAIGIEAAITSWNLIDPKGKDNL